MRFLEIGKKIVGVGRNFSEHAKELGNKVPTSPLIFLKPTSSYVREPGSILVPKTVTQLHHEVELAVIIGESVRNATKSTAMNSVAGYALALDMTARNLQDVAKKGGLPWTVAKGYDTFTPISDFIAKRDITDPHQVQLWCKVDEQLKQNGNTADMIFDIPSLIEYISGVMTLEPGDVILTGTPAGVGPVKPGQTLTCGLKTAGKSSDLITMHFPVKDRK